MCASILLISLSLMGCDSAIFNNQGNGTTIFKNYRQMDNSSPTQSGNAADNNSLNLTEKPPLVRSKDVMIGSFFLESFGEDEWNNRHIRGLLTDVVQDHDIIFLQGLDEQIEYFIIPGYSYKIVGQMDTVRGDIYQYLFYADDVVSNVSCYVIYDGIDRFIYPAACEIDIEGSERSIIYTSSMVERTNAEVEIRQIPLIHEKVVAKLSNNDIMLYAGPLYSDCVYYDEDQEISWYWITDDDEDTYVSQQDCTYDRFYTIDNYSAIIKESGVYAYQDVDKNLIAALSSHYPIFVRLLL